MPLLSSIGGGSVRSFGFGASALSVVRTSLIIHLDAGDTASYSGSGTIWNDISGNNNNFNIVAAAWQNSGPKYMNFGGSYGIAKNSSDISLSDSTGVTYVVWTRVLNSTGSWRTLTRSYVNDHQVIIESGGWNIGMYDNEGGAFQSTGFSQQNIPGNGTATWACLYWRWKNTAPYYEFSYNDTPGTIRASLSSESSRYNRGFGGIGGYHENNTTPSSASQYWGDIGVFMCYNRRLTDAELLQNYNYYKVRFSL